jgi:hypothetical protein
MNRNKKNLSEFVLKFQENESGKLEGGFVIITPDANNSVIGGSETNNCSGGNCVQGCGGTGPVPNGKACGPTG